MLSRERPFAPSGLLSAPAPLPNLAAAFSRRAAIFGAAATTCRRVPQPGRWRPWLETRLGELRGIEIVDWE